MRSLALLVLAIALGGCGAMGPVALNVPDDPHILNGEWVGRVTPHNAPSRRVQTVQMSTSATYVSGDTYSLVGTLTFHGVIYQLVGTGKGFWGATFTTQALESRPPSLFWDVTFLLGGTLLETCSGRAQRVAIRPKLP